MLNAPDNEKGKINATVNNVRHLAVVITHKQTEVKNV